MDLRWCIEKGTESGVSEEAKVKIGYIRDNWPNSSSSTRTASEQVNATEVQPDQPGNIKTYQKLKDLLPILLKMEEKLTKE